MYALIFQNRICQVEAVSFPVAPPLEWIECPEEATTSWSYRNGVFDPTPPEPELPKAAVPQSITMRQARLALLYAGFLEQVDAAIACMEGEQGAAARIEWEYAASVERNNPLFAAMAGSLELTDEALDQLFIAAAKL